MLVASGQPKYHPQIKGMGVIAHLAACASTMGPSKPTSHRPLITANSNINRPPNTILLNPL